MSRVACFSMALLTAVSSAAFAGQAEDLKSLDAKGFDVKSASVPEEFYNMAKGTYYIDNKSGQAPVVAQRCHVNVLSQVSALGGLKKNIVTDCVFLTPKKP